MMRGAFGGPRAYPVLLAEACTMTPAESGLVVVTIFEQE